MNKTAGKQGSEEVDFIILGVGTCGEDLSLQLLDAGFEVVGIEPSLVGGECPYWACLPSKMMIRAANSLKEAGRVSSFAGDVEINKKWSLVARRVREMTANWNDSAAVTRYEERGGRLIRGFGKITGPDTVTVEDLVFTARKGVVIATGSRPVMPPVPGLPDVEFWTTHSIIQMEELPQSIIIMGGGTSGCEFGQVLARFGVDVTIIETAGRLLPGEEPEASSLLENAFIDEGIDVHAGTSVQKVESRDGMYFVKLSGGQELSAERLLVTTGRRVVLEGLGLESVGIDETADFIPVDENMHVREKIWAMGDVTGKGFYTHVGLYQSAIIASQFLGKDYQPATYHAVPRGIFTDPEIGSVGIKESDALDAGIPVAVTIKQLPATFRGAVHGIESGIIKLVTDSEKGILLGATVAGPSAIDLLGMLNLAVHARIPVAELRSMIYTFPSSYSAVGEALGAYGRGVTTVLDPEYKGTETLDAVVYPLGQHTK